MLLAVRLEKRILAVMNEVARDLTSCLMDLTKPVLSSWLG